MYQHLRTMARREDGASAVEYALLVVAIALIMVFGAFALGNAIRSNLNKSASCVSNVSSTATSCPG